VGIKYLPQPNEYHKYYYIDVEANGLWPDKLWMMCASRMDRDEVLSFVGHEQIRRFFDELRGTDTYFVGHNAISYDCVHTQRLANGLANTSNTVDTLVLSYLYDPSLPGGHSLEAWGERLKDPKGSFNDWSGYSPEMDTYCQQDVRLGKKVAKALWQRMSRMGYSELSCQIEHEIREVLDEQQRNGWYFDIAGAQALFSQLRAEQSDLEQPIRELFPPQLEVYGTYNRRFKRDGSDYATYNRHLSEYPEVRHNDDGTYSVLDWSEFNIGSPKQRVERLLELGWEPVSYTEKGFPKVDEESLVAYAELSKQPAVQAIADWLVLQGRSTMIETWLNNVNYDDSCMHGRVITCGATTRRMTHNSPNTANIPKAKKKVKYGIECRRLWRARPNRVQVGYDASGLEMRMFAQYLNNEEATTLFTTGDPHIVNTRNLGLPDEMRDITVKNGFYAYLYGAQDPKLGRTLKPELQGIEAKIYGKEARSILEKGTPGLSALVAEIKDEFKHTGGVLRSIDGGFVRCPSQHAALNYKLQSAGAIVMKAAAIIARREIIRKGLDSLLVGTIHDEGQHDVDPKDGQEVGSTCVSAIAQAGEVLGFHVPLTGEYKIGANWAECH
jgi:DNA polymerase I-like protein with 3'-5' exonuclease and polymerase domains